MKLMNTKTMILMLASVVIFVLSGCDSKTGIPSDSQLIGLEDSTPAANASEVQLGLENSTPVANAGEVQPVIMKNSNDLYTVTLDGSKSFDADGDELTYRWTLVSKPTRSELDFEGSDAVDPSFDADIIGDYTFDLVVNDGKVDSEPSRVTISVKAYRIELTQYTNSSGESSTTLLTYNEDGQGLTEQLSKNDGKTREITYTYDANGNRLTSTHVDKDSNGTVTSLVERTYTYDADGNLLRDIGVSKDSGGTVFYSIERTYTYDADGNQLTSTYVSRDSSGAVTYSSESTYTYDADGNQLTSTYVDKSSSGAVTFLQERTYTYDADGNRLTSTYVAKNSSGVVTYSFETIYTYDEDGNQLTYHHENSNGYIEDKIYSWILVP